VFGLGGGAVDLGNPKGNATVDAKGSGTFTILGEGHEVELLEGSRQDKRLGGRFVKSETYTDRKGREKARLLLKDLEVQITLTGPTSANAVIRYNDRTIKVAGSANIRPSKPAGKGINLAGHFKTTKGTLGLNEGAADQDDVVTIEYWAPGRP